MADDNNSTLDKGLIKSFNDLKKATDSLVDATETLSKKHLAKFTDGILEAIKANGLADDATLEHIKSEKNLTKKSEELAFTLGVIEKRHEAAIKLSKEEEKLTKKILKKGGHNTKDSHPAIVKAARDQAREQLKDRYKEHGLSLDMIDAYKEGAPAVRNLAKSHREALAVGDKLNKAQDWLVGGITKSVSKFGEAAFGAEMLGKAFWQTYESMASLSKRGMVGAFGTLQLASHRLLINSKDLEEILNRNRDIVNNLGGGVKGVDAFVDEISRARDAAADAGASLSYLGKDANKAIVRMIESSRNAGLTPKDGAAGKAYRDNLNASIKQFKEFNRTFGMTDDEYGTMMDQLSDESDIRRKLNLVDEKGRYQLEEEIRQRAANLKAMGFSNDQLVKFNESIGRINDRWKDANDITNRQTQGLGIRSAYTAQMGVLANSTDPEDQKKLKQLQDSYEEMMKMTDLFMNHPEMYNKEKTSIAGLKYQEALYVGHSAMADKNQYQTQNAYGQARMGGVEYEDQVAAGKTAATAHAQKKATEYMSDDQKKDMAENNRKIQDDNMWATTFKVLAPAIEHARMLLAEPFSAALIGATALLLAFNGGLVKNLASMGSGAKGLLGRFLGRGAAGAAAEGIAAGAGAEAATGAAAVGGTSLLAGVVAPLAIAGGGAYINYKMDKSKEAEARQNFKDGKITQDQLNRTLAVTGGAPEGGSWIDRKLGGIFGGKSQSDTTSTSTSAGSSSTSTMPYNFDSYAEKIGKRESGGNYGSINKWNYIGKYQMGAAALVDVGLVKKGTTNSGLGDPSNWLTPGGMQGFLNDPQAQESAFQAYTDMHYRQLIKAGVITPQSSPQEVAGYLAAAHLKGIGGAIDLSRGINGQDALGTKTSSYFDLGAGTQMGTQLAQAPTSQAPTSNTILNPPFSQSGSGSSSMLASAGIDFGKGTGWDSTSGTTPITASPATMIAKNDQLDELKKHTDLLATLVRTVNSSGKMSRPDYAQDTGIILNGYA
jgi:hypothetical protein